MAADGRLLLFAGHMVDRPDRAQPRFPAAHVPAAERALATLLDDLQAGARDHALSQGAAGGDLLFSEACVRRGVALQWLPPLDEAAFIEQSVLPSVNGSSTWLPRYRALRTRLPVQHAPQVLGPLPASEDAFVRGNTWLLDTALASPLPLHFIALWDGGGGDGPGGTADLMQQVRQHAGTVHWIDTRTLRA